MVLAIYAISFGTSLIVELRRMLKHSHANVWLHIQSGQSTRTSQCTSMYSISQVGMESAYTTRLSGRLADEQSAMIFLKWLEMLVR